jgi:predicted DNA-binding transcriptional regulator YafY
VRLVLYYGDYAKVLAPDELRKIVAEQAQAVADLYKNSID